MRRSLRARLDRGGRRALAGVDPAARFEAAQRKLGITRSGQIALVGCVMLWVMARVVAGTAMYLFAYGLVLLVGAGLPDRPAQAAAHRRRGTGSSPGRRKATASTSR